MSIATKAGGGAAKYLDERTSSNKFLKKNLGKIFPDHWSFMLGEIALYSFIVLLLSGTFLALFFKPSMTEVVYNGSYVPLNGIKMSEAYASSLDISFDVRGGLLMRQIHHWAALIFVASIMVHLMRVFFTGAFRKPRELNWLIGVVLLTMALLAGFSGYSLPDDLLSGTGLRIAEGVMLSIPVVGTYLSMFVFGGEFPGIDFIPRLYTVHELFIPGAILGLVTVHLMLVWYQKHTQYPGPGRTNENVVGFRLFPIYTAKAGGFFFSVFGVIALLGALATVNPIWLYGPYMPDQITAGSQPDFYIGFLEGSLRMTPPIEWTILGYTISWNVLIPGLILPGIMFTLMGIYPFLEKWITKDNSVHNLLDRPRNAATRTALGVMALTFYGILFIGGGNDILATTFSLSINSITRALQVLIIIGPPIAFVITRRICLGLQRRDREKLLHGRESGIIRRTPEGEFYEVHAPLSVEEKAVLTSRQVIEPLAIPPATDDNGVRNPGGRTERLRARLSRFYFGEQIPMPTAAEIAAADEHLAHDRDHTLEPARTTEVAEGEVSEFGQIMQSEALPRDRTPAGS
jgi:ubiquinol-cytochrome c reductase cytochrome b subunit